MAEINRKRIIVDVLPEMHAEIKARAAKRCLTIKAYVTGSILEQMKRDKKYE